jgi:hypothetical protein
MPNRSQDIRARNQEKGKKNSLYTVFGAEANLLSYALVIAFFYYCLDSHK